MKTQNLFMKGALLFSLLVIVCILSQCTTTNCIAVSRENPSFSGCWLTEFSHPSSADTSIKGNIIEKEIPVEISVNSERVVSGKWWSALDSTAIQGTLTGRLNLGNKIDGLNFVGTDTTGGSDIDFQLSSTGLTFSGTYGALPRWRPITRRFYWNGTKISDCACTESILKNHQTYKVK